MEQEHKRRVRYKGTHPRNYKEKYKEHNPEKYQADVEKIIGRGQTPAGMHISIMVNEILDFLQNPARSNRLGCHPRLWRSYAKNAGAFAGAGSYVRN